MKIDVLGLGESLKEFMPSKNITIGVNDIYKHYPVDYVLTVDRPSRFTKERLQTIKDSYPKKFYTHLNDWKGLVDNLELFKFAIGGRCSINEIDSEGLLYSNNSTFVACVLAYKMGATTINIFGADFNTHPNFKDKSLENVLSDFKKLLDFFKSKDIQINISKGSKLNELI